ncbi:hypothetical protein [Saccharolobus caldissimus]|uniref:Uncharacterized protein n=1 Tax=Saccharolobus caldissimus TaxID=1702097 RepID=A0AAQ4CNV6_9CREN|nr:hypothetical protein [Saccharolobus caldissimus]BDB97487.1 hypothetical protein SACC_05040 [Saccharolobus caldissimus]
MVKLREVTIIKDPSLLNEKLGPFKIKKLLPLALGGMLGYGIIRKGTVDDIIVGIIVIIASLIIAFGPDRSLSFENQLQAMIYYYTLKSKGVKVNTQPTKQQATQLTSLKPEELELKISELKQRMKEEKDIVRRLMLKKELLTYEVQYYTAELSDIEQKIQQLKVKMKTADKTSRSKISAKLKELYKKKSDITKAKNKANVELRKFEKIVLIDNHEINKLKQRVEELKKEMQNNTDKKKLRELKVQYRNALLEYYEKKILQDTALLRLVSDKVLKSKISSELKELRKKKAELEKKTKGNIGLLGSLLGGKK